MKNIFFVSELMFLFCALIEALGLGGLRDGHSDRSLACHTEGCHQNNNKH